MFLSVLSDGSLGDAERDARPPPCDALAELGRDPLAEFGRDALADDGRDPLSLLNANGEAEGES